jgi:hypothetical protein
MYDLAKQLAVPMVAYLKVEPPLPHRLQWMPDYEQYSTDLAGLKQQILTTGFTVLQASRPCLLLENLRESLTKYRYQLKI